MFSNLQFYVADCIEHVSPVDGHVVLRECVEFSSDDGNQTLASVYTAFTFTFTYALPLLLLLINFSVIVKRLGQSDAILENRRERYRRRARRQASVFLVSCIYLLLEENGRVWQY